MGADVKQNQVMLTGESELGRNMSEIAFPCLRFPYLINVNIIYIYIYMPAFACFNQHIHFI